MRNKKYNKNKSVIVKSTGVVKDLCVYRVSEDPSHLININKGTSVKHNHIRNAITDFRFQWSLYVALFGFESNGKRKMDGEQINLSSVNYYSELTDLMLEAQDKLIKRNEGKVRIKNIGLAAVPVRGYEFDDLQSINDVFTKLGAYK